MFAIFKSYKSPLLMVAPYNDASSLATISPIGTTFSNKFFSVKM